LSTTSIIGAGRLGSRSLQKFAAIYQRAAKRKGGVDALEALLPKPKTAAQLKRVADDRYLAEMTKCVFRSGFVWQVIENKWPGFEAAFAGFDVMSCAMLSDEDLERLAADTRIVRNAAKIASVRSNANFIRELRASHGSCGAYLAAWPVDDIVGLWHELKQRGARLGGNTGAFFLRFVGKDTFMLSADVVAALQQQKVVDKAPTSRKALAAVQAAFNGWREESGRSLAEISRTLACSVGST
jgi:3-methyladenine DNA glycosylase Tag